MTATETYVFTGGGTGGHLFPGLAVAEELRARRPDCRIVFVGSDRPIEAEVLAREHAEHVALPIRSSADLKQRPWRFVIDNLRSLRAAGRLLRELRPRAVLGLGGFASLPTLVQARWQRIPTLLLEQNAIPGRVTRLCARSARTVCLTFAEAAARLPGTHGVVTGNPVRRSIAALHQAQPETRKPILLILGGSQGAESLNAAVCHWIQSAPSALQGWTVWHQTGARQQAELAAEYARLGIAGEVAAFWTDLPERYSRASVVISRAGATTIAELLCARLPMVLLPYPHAADNHQQANALSLGQAGAARVVPHAVDPVETVRQLAEAVEPLLASTADRQRLSDVCGPLARPLAARSVVDLLLAAAPR